MNELFSLLSKRAALQKQHSTDDLERSDASQELVDRIQTFTADADASIGDLSSSQTGSVLTPLTALDGGETDG